jgi:hypothetical protein
MVPETDGFKVLATWNHQGMIVQHGRSRDPAQFAELETISAPGALGRKGGASRAKRMTTDERKAARNRWQNR